jgi:hypothetical protein
MSSPTESIAIFLFKLLYLYISSMTLKEAIKELEDNSEIIDKDYKIGYIKNLIIMPLDEYLSELIPKFSIENHRDILSQYSAFRILVEIDISEVMDTFQQPVLSLEDVQTYLSKHSEGF